MRLIAFWWFFALAVLVCGQGCSRNESRDAALAVMEKARTAWLASDYARAEEQYQQYLQQFQHGADRLEAWQRLADIDQNVKGEPALAASVLESALLEFEAKPAVHDDLAAAAATAWLQAGEPERASIHLRNFLDRKALPIDKRVHFSLQLTRALTKLNKLTDAVAVLEQCRQADPDPAATAPCTLGAAAVRRDMHELDVARSLWKQLFENTALDTSIRAAAGFALGEEAEARHARKEAVAWYTALRDIYPNPAVIDKKLDYLRQ